MKEEKEGRDKRRRSRNWVEGRDWISCLRLVVFFLVVARENGGNERERSTRSKGREGI